MAIIPMVEATAEPAEFGQVFEQLRRTRGRVPGMYRTLAHQPAILAAHRAYFHGAGVHARGGIRTGAGRGISDEPRRRNGTPSYGCPIIPRGEEQ